jgi:molybdate transport system permease protein
MRIRRPLSPLLTLLGLLALALLTLPVIALAWRVPWSSFFSAVGDGRTALLLSLRTSLMATILVVCTGVPLAWLIARGPHWFSGVARPLALAPLVFPPTVAGLALLALLGRSGVVGEVLSTWQITIPFTTIAVVIAQTFVAMPFMVLTMESAFRVIPRDLIDSAVADGASESQVLRMVAGPHVTTSLIAGTLLTWARALGEFGATITFAGSFPGVTRTVPIEVYLGMERSPESAYALSFVLVAISLAVILSLRSRWVAGIAR